MHSASIVIPTLNAGATIGRLVTNLQNQSIPLEQILIVDSSSDDDTVNIAKSHGADVIQIRRDEFDHGGTRHLGVESTRSDFVLFMTQDALPIGNDYISSILAPFVNSEVAMVSGKQVPRSDAKEFEKLVREFNYQDFAYTRSLKDLPRYGIKTFFASDVCSAYRREAYVQCGGFERQCRTNEDMLMAAKFISKGFSIAYEPQAAVLHSHNFSFVQQYRRNKEIGFFLSRYKENFLGASEFSEGKSMVKYVSTRLIRERKVGELFLFSLDCLARIIGNYTGKTLYNYSAKRS